MNNEPMFLSAGELVELTGYKLAAHQCRWLKEHGWTFECNASSRPIVAREHALIRLGARRGETPRAFLPNFSALAKPR